MFARGAYGVREGEVRVLLFTRSELEHYKEGFTGDALCFGECPIG